MKKKLAKKAPKKIAKSPRRTTGTRKTATAAARVASRPAGATEKIAGIKTEAVRKATGKTWAEWFRILDRAGATTLPHREIAEWVFKHHPEIGGWWSQMVTVGYEQARGLREKHQKPGGYEVSASKTLQVGVGAAFRAFEDVRTRRQWLPDPIEIRKATKDRSMRVTWQDGTHLDANFYAKGADRSQVTVQHRKLASASDAARMKSFWGERLSALKELLEARS